MMLADSAGGFTGSQENTITLHTHTASTRPIAATLRDARIWAAPTGDCREMHLTKQQGKEADIIGRFTNPFGMPVFQIAPIPPTSEVVVVGTVTDNSPVEARWERKRRTMSSHDIWSAHEFVRGRRRVLSAVFAISLTAACDNAAVLEPAQQEEAITAIITPPGDEPGDGSAPVFRKGDVIPSEMYGATVFWIEPDLTVSGSQFAAQSAGRARHGAASGAADGQW